MGAAFDDALITEVARVISTEARAFNNANRTGLDFWTPVGCFFLLLPLTFADSELLRTSTRFETPDGVAVKKHLVKIRTICLLTSKL